MILLVSFFVGCAGDLRACLPAVFSCWGALMARVSFAVRATRAQPKSNRENTGQTRHTRPARLAYKIFIPHTLIYKTNDD